MTDTPKTGAAPGSEHTFDGHGGHSPNCQGCLVADLRAQLERAQADLAECFRLSGADPDGNEDWRLAPDAVREVRRLREESDAADDEVADLTAKYHDAESKLYAAINETNERAETAECELAEARAALKKCQAFLERQSGSDHARKLSEICATNLREAK
jgi:hypothetical protein